MKSRVIPYAKAHDSGYFKALPDEFYKFTEIKLPNYHDDIHLWVNKKWINYQMMQGRKLVDIGQPDGLRPSIYYDMEHEQVERYGQYILDIQP